MKNYFEAFVGFATIIVAISFVLFAFKTTGKTNAAGSYDVKANFSNIDGISAGSDIKIAGIKIGVVAKTSIDQTSYNATALLSVNKDVKVPVDSSIAVRSSGFLGGKFLAISPGGSDEYMTEGSSFEIAESSVSLEELLGKFMFNSGSKNAETTK